MPLIRAVAACAVSALAMVFSVQQGAHGPLVVYKLQVPGPPAVAAPMAPTALPLETRAESQAPAGVVTLKQVNDALTWRRETAEKLPKAPFAPRF